MSMGTRFDGPTRQRLRRARKHEGLQPEVRIEAHIGVSDSKPAQWVDMEDACVVYCEY